jgi:hypothetical protein
VNFDHTTSIKFNRLSTQEKQIVLHLSKFDIPITRDYLKEGLIDLLLILIMGYSLYNKGI